MFSRTVTYTDFNGVECNEKLYFHMLVPEFMDLQFNPNFDGDFAEYIKTAMLTEDRQKIYTFFKLMIVNSYGHRSADGSEFDKKAEWTERFLNSLSYEEFFMWLVENPKNAESFWNGIVPAKLLEKGESMVGTDGQKKKLTEMTKDELVALMQKATEAKAIAA